MGFNDRKHSANCRCATPVARRGIPARAAMPNAVGWRTDFRVTAIHSPKTQTADVREPIAASKRSRRPQPLFKEDMPAFIVKYTHRHVNTSTDIGSAIRVDAVSGDAAVDQAWVLLKQRHPGEYIVVTAAIRK